MANLVALTAAFFVGLLVLLPGPAEAMGLTPGGFSSQAKPGGGGLKATRQGLRKARMGQTAARAGAPRPDSREEQKEKLASFTRHEDCTAYVAEQTKLVEQRARMQGREPPAARKRDVCAHLAPKP